MNRLFSLLDSYCYGPVDLLQVRRGDSTLWLALRDPAGRPVQAIYRGCVYWRLGPEQAGCRLSLVQQVSARQLADRPDSVTFLELQSNARDVERLLQDWERAGLHLYLHLTRQSEYLVAARSLEYGPRTP